MRLRTSATAAVLAAIAPAVMVLLPAATAAADPTAPPAGRERSLEPYCGDPDSEDFPLEARIRGGRKAYEAGAGKATWKLDLRNTTDAECRNIHPIAVLVDRNRALTTERIGLEFFDGGAGDWRSVSFETTEESEHIGVFEGDGFDGFEVEPHKKITVKVRMGFGEGTKSDHVRMNVAAVQRREDDGDWIGESDDYEFDIRGDGEASAADAGRSDGTAGDGSGSGRDQARDGSGAGVTHESRRSDGLGARQPNDPRPQTPGEADVLARTGRAALTLLGIVAGVCVVGGAVLVTLARRRAR
ncbi:hypothetical protein [Streptomyces sp. NPDC047108]|uniref:hypothetical protein n=1 Tax=Streptomyces sp. NPDC047108 TaxID=3155025 RepID=UPI0033D30B27